MRYLLEKKFRISTIIWVSFCVSCATAKSPYSSQIFDIELGGITQSIAVVGDPAKPALILLHGGGLPLPGVASKSKYPVLNENFLVIYWDQRGTGRSTKGNWDPGSLNLLSYLNDIDKLTEHIKNKYNKEKVYLVGHSWGAMLGLLSIQNHPNNYAGYIGVSQQINLNNSDLAVYQQLMATFQKENNQSQIRKLLDLGQPPYADVHDWLQLREMVARNGGLVSGQGEIGMLGMLQRMMGSFIFNSDYPWFESTRIQANMNTTMEGIYTEMVDYDQADITHLSIPIAFIHGKYDLNSHPSVFEKWYANVEAPSKKYIRFNKSAHMPMWEEPKKFEYAIVKFIQGFNQ